MMKLIKYTLFVTFAAG